MRSTAKIRGAYVPPILTNSLDNTSQTRVDSTDDICRTTGSTAAFTLYHPGLIGKPSLPI